jgi:hypothetical protein
LVACEMITDAMFDARLFQLLPILK